MLEMTIVIDNRSILEISHRRVFEEAKIFDGILHCTQFWVFGQFFLVECEKDRKVIQINNLIQILRIILIIDQIDLSLLVRHHHLSLGARMKGFDRGF